MRTDMKTKTYIITLLLAIAAASACTREKLDPAAVNNPAAVENGSQVLVPFTAEAGEPQTRVAMDGSTNNIVFSAGDQLLVYCWKIVEPSILTLQSGAGQRSATFTGNLVLAAGKTEADLAGKTLNASLIPQEGVSQGIFNYNPNEKRLTVDYSTKSIDSDLDALFSRTAIYQGSTKYEDRRFEFRLLTGYLKMDVTVPSEESSLARDYTVQVTADYHIPTTATNSGLGWSGSGEYAAISGTLRASSATRGTAYMAILADSSMRVEDDGVMYDEVKFQITMDNVYKEYDLVGGVIDKQVIEPGKGYTKSVTLRDNPDQDVLLGQPTNVHDAFMTSTVDRNNNSRVSKYEAAQVVNMVSLTNYTSLTNADFLRYFTGLTSLTYQGFMGCRNLSTVVIPKNVTEIETQGFANCYALKTVFIPAKVKSIGLAAFSDCTSLTSVVYDDLSQLESMDSNAFSGCASLITMVMPASLKTIGTGAFKGCTALESVQFKSSARLTSIGKNAFQDCTSLDSFAFPSGIKAIADKTFFGCTALEVVTMKSTVETIGAYAFSGCTALRSISLPATSITAIGNAAFQDCSSLKSLSLPSRITSIEDDTFYGCSSLASITIPYNVTKIGKRAFRGCSVLTSISIPGTVTEIGDYAFYYCGKLASVYCGPATPPTLGVNVFLSCSNDLVIYVMVYSSLNAYRSAPNWTTYRHIIQVYNG